MENLPSPHILKKCICNTDPILHVSPLDDASWVSCPSCGKDTFLDRSSASNDGISITVDLWNNLIKKERKAKRKRSRPV
jgi:hypothetical protein